MAEPLKPVMIGCKHYPLPEGETRCITCMINEMEFLENEVKDIVVWWRNQMMMSSAKEIAAGVGTDTVLRNNAIRRIRLVSITISLNAPPYLNFCITAYMIGKARNVLTNIPSKFVEELEANALRCCELRKIIYNESKHTIEL